MVWGWELTHRRPDGRQLIVLSAFHGIGAVSWLLHQEFGKPLLAVAWETDAACCKLASIHMTFASEADPAWASIILGSSAGMPGLFPCPGWAGPQWCALHSFALNPIWVPQP